MFKRLGLPLLVDTLKSFETLRDDRMMEAWKGRSKNGEGGGNNMLIKIKYLKIPDSLPELITVIILISLKLSFVNRKYFRLYLFKVEGSYLASLTLTFRGGQGIEGRRQWKVLIQRTINLLAARPCPPS